MLGRNDGDVNDYYKFVRENNKFEELGLVGLALWRMMDLFLTLDFPSSPIYRVIDYGVSGQKPQNPYAPGKFSLATEGYLSSNGPLYGLQLYYHLTNINTLPSFASIEAWASPLPSKQGIYPLGFTLNLERLPIYSTESYSFGVSGNIGLSFQQRPEWETSESNVNYGFYPEGGAKVSIAGKSWELFAGMQYRGPNTIWNESANNSGFKLVLGGTWFLSPKPH